MESNMGNLNEIIESLQKVPGKKIEGFAKKLTYAIIILTFLIGVIGSFNVLNFNMNSFVKFIPVFSALFIPLIISIGVNSAFDKKNKTEIEKEMMRLKEKNEEFEEKNKDLEKKVEGKDD